MATNDKPSTIRGADQPAADRKLMDGRALAKRVREAAAAKVEKIRQATGITPCLATVLVGSDPASVAYTRMKRKRCADAGINPHHIELPAPTTTQQLVATVSQLAADSSIHGILVQHPVPKPIYRRAAFEMIPLAKDVDGVSSAALGRFILGMPAFIPCTPAGIMRLLAEYGVELDGALAACALVGVDPSTVAQVAELRQCVENAQLLAADEVASVELNIRAMVLHKRGYKK